MLPLILPHADHGGPEITQHLRHVVSLLRNQYLLSAVCGFEFLRDPPQQYQPKVMEMFENIEENVTNWEDETNCTYLRPKILDRGNIRWNWSYLWVWGRTVLYPVRSTLCDSERIAKKLSAEKHREKFARYESVETHLPASVSPKRRLLKPVCANVDFYSGFVYQCLAFQKSSTP